MEELLPVAADVGVALKEAGADDAKVGVCPRSGHDLLVKSSAKFNSQFVGCSGWPECDVTFPLPKGRIEPVDDACPECGTPQVKVIQFRQKPRVICLDPACPTNFEPPVVVGPCRTCAEAGRTGELTVMRSPKTLKRFVRCTNYETCRVSYPLPQNGEIAPTDEVCEPCGAPKVIVHTGKGPWKICIDPECPAKDEPKGRSGKGRGKAGRGGGKGAGKSGEGGTKGGKGAGKASKGGSEGAGKASKGGNPRATHDASPAQPTEQ